MKRNPIGINLDEGLPLVSEEEFRLLYINCFEETENSLHKWIGNDSTPLMLGGQIGSGKTTLIRKVFDANSRKPDIEIHMDKDTLNKDAGDFWGITLVEFVKAAIKNDIDLSFSKLPQEIGDLSPNDWMSLINFIFPVDFSLESFDKKKQIRRKLADNRDYISSIVKELGIRIQKVLKRQIFIFVSGIDKFNQGTPSFFEMEEVLRVLAEFKTLYEVNFVHFFSRIGTTFNSMERIFIPIVKPEAIFEILSKRMGVYTQPVRNQLSFIAEWSGGNPRQAIRLLSHFETARKKRERSLAEMLAYAIYETAGDFFSFSPRPSHELISYINRTNRIQTTTFLLPGDKETALRALYGNWILIKKTFEAGSWEVIVNPVVKPAFDLEINPEEPEFKLLSEYASLYGISKEGLDFNIIDEKTLGKKSGEQLLWEYLGASIEHPLHSNLTEILDILSSALLSKDRKDRVIIGFRDESVLEAARAYLFAKANTYEYQSPRHIAVEGGVNKQPEQVLEQFLQETDTDIFSIEFTGKWTDDQLDSLDRQRDRFIDTQFIWWIPYQNLKNYLPHWIQLRQLFVIFVLEDELLGSISLEEIEADLAFFNDLVENKHSSEANVVLNLNIVLDYLKKKRSAGASSHG